MISLRRALYIYSLYPSVITNRS